MKLMRGNSHKILAVAAVLVLSVGLVGCEKKTPTTTTLSGTGSQTATSGSVGTGSTLGGEVSGGSTGSTVELPVAATELDATFKKNYQDALASANGSLKNQAKFCTVLIEFREPSQVHKADQSFFFYSDDEKLKDWYWIVQFDQLNKKMRRLFAARKDYSDEVQCSASSTEPVSYTQSLTTFYASSTMQSLDLSQLAKFVFSYVDGSWKVSVLNKEGMTIYSEQISGSTTATTSATPTATTTGTARSI